MSEENLEKQIIKAIHKSVSFLYPKENCSFSKCKENNFLCCKNDIYLLKNDIHEQTISGKIYHYLDKFLESDLESSDLSIDIEFNKHMASREHSKKNVICSNNANCDLKDKICNETNKYRPDIILHQRGIDDKNILIIECKKTQTITGKKVKNDFDKLKAFTCNNGNFKYKIGVSIIFNDKCPIFIYFLNKNSLGDEKDRNIIKLLKEQNRGKNKIYIYQNSSETLEKLSYKDYRKKYIKNIDEV